MNFKKLSVALITVGFVGICTTAYADSDTGFYIGGQLGYGNANYGSGNPHNLNNPTFSALDLVSLFPHINKSEDGLAGRIYAGYQFNQYVGAETGYTLFSNNTYKGNDNPYHDFTNVTLKTQVWDILGKVGMSSALIPCLRADLKAGAAYVMTTQDVNTNLPVVFSGHHENTWEPAAGASLTYNFNKNIGVDISYLHTFGSDDIDSPNTDLVTLGASYRFA